MKKKTRKATRQKKAELKASPESEQRVSRVLIEALVTAERHGLLRPMLQALNFAFRKMEERAKRDYQSVSYRHLRAGKDAVVGYITSLLSHLDAETKAGILSMLIADFATFGSTGDKTTRDERGSWGVLLAMRQIVAAYCAIVEQGDGTLASELPLYAAELVEALARIVERNPEVIRGIAGEMIEWPIMASRHYPKKSDFKAIAERIGLASTSPVKPRESHTWKPTTPLNRYLIRMLVVERWGDGRELTKQSVPYYLDEVLMPLFEKVATEEGGWENYEEFSGIASSAAKRGKRGVQRSEIRSRVKKALDALASDS